MTDIDFYVIPAKELAGRLQFCCKLVEIAYKKKLSVFVYHQDSVLLEQLDELLWSYKAESFIPHSVDEKFNKAAVCLSNHSPNEQPFDYMINLDNSIPDFFSQFKRMSEIVSQEPDVTTYTREHYRHYRHRGYPLKTHDLRHKMSS